ncbi:hypothetical protein ECG_02210 [Echinococcus granulosus]|uniref:Expressed protein n=1 Tax=Echinococcus granulosus TaxID=6210 RepID=A0A068WNN9_ECHGR|nr:hypothetical protein ECG_02210 [Echinococcus granulosus]CDS21743.1 expressed protein [Echinococcus granulosus]
MPRDRSRSPLSRRRRSRSRSRERYRERHDRESDRRRRDGDRYRRDHTPEKRKERRHGHFSDEHRVKESKGGKSWRDSRSRTPDQIENVIAQTMQQPKKKKQRPHKQREKWR